TRYRSNKTVSEGTWSGNTVEVFGLLRVNFSDSASVAASSNEGLIASSRHIYYDNTGSGKSTLTLSFFHFVEHTEGRITVDGLDISTIALSDLRSKVSIINPYVGTLRSIMNVFDEHENAEIVGLHSFTDLYSKLFDVCI
ncbi:hypothetical protein AZE42_09985, partial [Rhizopogon vesiculosus]